MVCNFTDMLLLIPSIMTNVETAGRVLLQDLLQIDFSCLAAACCSHPIHMHRIGHRQIQTWPHRKSHELHAKTAQQPLHLQPVCRTPGTASPHISTQPSLEQHLYVADFLACNHSYYFDIDTRQDASYILRGHFKPGFQSQLLHHHSIQLSVHLKLPLLLYLQTPAS